MPTVYILFSNRFICYQIRCKNNRELNNWFDALECREELQGDLISVREKEQIISSFLKIKSLNTVPFSYAAMPHYFWVVRKDMVIHLDLSTKLFSSNLHNNLEVYDRVLTINFINDDKNSN